MATDGFTILTVRSGESGDSPLYPFPGEPENTVEPQEDDGAVLGPFRVTELVVHEIRAGGTPRRLVRLEDLKASLIVSDSRVALPDGPRRERRHAGVPDGVLAQSGEAARRCPSRGAQHPVERISARQIWSIRAASSVVSVSTSSA
jgi:hypothetical protein